jgi:hypothetical protein
MSPRPVSEALAHERADSAGEEKSPAPDAAISSRLALLDEVLAAPPSVHSYDESSGMTPPRGVWSSPAACYRFLAAHCPAGSRTLETGLGLSTALFTLWGCTHTCVVPWEEEPTRLKAYLADRKADVSRLRIEVGHSQEVLPRLPADPLDLVLLDGGHGFPVPIIDWFYAGSRLVEGGLLVIDDLQLPSVTLGLIHFLTSDPRWTEVAREERWGAWRRETSGPLGEEWSWQKFLF